MARRFKTTVQLDSGLLIPAGAVAGRVLTTDASGNATWQTVTAGAPGLNGSVIYSGMGSPPANVGLPGDYWFDTNTGTMYGPKGTNANSSLNLHPNPSVETDITGWTSTASSGGPATVRERTTDWAVHGSWSYHVSFGRVPAASSTINTGPTAGTTGKIPVDSAKRYSFQLYHRIRSIVATPPQIMLRIYWYKADGSASTVLGSTVTPYITVAAGDVVRFVAYNIAPPSDAAYVVPNLYMGSVDSWDSDTDAVVVVEGTTLPQEWPTSGTVLKGATGATGATGPTGPQGPQGDTPVILASSLPAHAASHDAGGTDPMVANANYLTPSLRSLDPSQAGSAMNGQWSLANISGAILNAGNVEMNSKKLINLATPTSINDAANKGYVDGKAPAAHASTHQPGGSDAMAVDAAAAVGSLRTLGAGANQAAAGNDTRLRPRFAAYKQFEGPITVNTPGGSTSGDPVTIPDTGDYLWHFNGMIFASTANQLVYLDLWIDGVLKANSKRWLNQVNFYQSFPGGTVVLPLTAGVHYVWMRIAGTGVASDVNARFWWSVN
jgi:hypothetical protein